MNNLNYYFDKEADILYFSKGKTSSRSVSKEVEDGIIARIDPLTKEVVGFTILDFVKREKGNFSSVSIPFEAKFALMK